MLGIRGTRVRHSTRIGQAQSVAQGPALNEEESGYSFPS